MVCDVLCVTAVQGQNGWGVTYTSNQICAVKGSTVEINCSFIYPPRINNQSIKVEKRFWLINWGNGSPVDLKTDPNYGARVKYDFYENTCTLRITDLRMSDAAKYNFRFETNQESGRYTGVPGVTLSVAGTIFIQR